MMLSVEFAYRRMTWLTPPLLWFEIIVLALVCWCTYKLSKASGSRIVLVRDWLSYIAIGIALVAVIVFVAAKKLPLSWKWIAFAVNTALVFGYTFRVVRQFWTKPRFWAVITVLALLHGMVG